jgi:hypothetical protein
MDTNELIDMLTIDDPLQIDARLVLADVNDLSSECCGASINLSASTCTKCGKECDWSLDSNN